MVEATYAELIMQITKLNFTCLGEQFCIKTNKHTWQLV